MLTENPALASMHSKAGFRFPCLLTLARASEVVREADMRSIHFVELAICGFSSR